MIQWFPGHMAKAMHQIKEMAAMVDLFIVILDARAPLATYNAEFDALAPHKPRLIVISKVDWGDHNKLLTIKVRFKHQNQEVLLVNLKKSHAQKQIWQVAAALLAPKRHRDLKKGILNPRLRAMVIGVPNVGKSTLINLVAQKAKVKVANTPGVTRACTWINAGCMQLMDTPGILWPNLTKQEIALKLAMIGVIKSTILPQEVLFYESYKLLSKHYAAKLKNLGLLPTFDKIEMYSELMKLCEKRKFITKHNKLDLRKAMTFFGNYVKNLKGVTYD